VGTLQLTEIISEVKDHFAQRPDLTDAKAVVALNIAQERMARAHDFEELEVIDTGTVPFTSTPSNDRFFPFTSLGVGNTEPREVYSFRVIEADARHAKLEQWSVRQFDKEVPDPEYLSVGFPRHYLMWSEKFELYRIPDQAYTYNIRMSTWPAAFSTSDLTAKSSFNRKDDILMTLSISWIWNRLGEYERANRHFGIFSTLWNQAVEEDNKKPDRDIVPAFERGRSGFNAQYWLDPFVKGVR